MKQLIKWRGLAQLQDKTTHRFHSWHEQIVDVAPNDMPRASQLTIPPDTYIFSTAFSKLPDWQQPIN